MKKPRPPKSRRPRGPSLLVQIQEMHRRAQAAESQRIDTLRQLEELRRECEVARAAVSSVDELRRAAANLRARAGDSEQRMRAVIANTVALAREALDGWAGCTADRLTISTFAGPRLSSATIPDHEDNTGITCRNSGLPLHVKNVLHDCCGWCHDQEEVMARPLCGTPGCLARPDLYASRCDNCLRARAEVR